MKATKQEVASYSWVLITIALSAAPFSEAGFVPPLIGQTGNGSAAECAKARGRARSEFTAIEKALADAETAKKSLYMPILARTAAGVMASENGSEALSSHKEILAEIQASAGDSSRVDWEAVRADAEYNATAITNEVVRHGKGPMAGACRSTDPVWTRRTGAPGVSLSCEHPAFDGVDAVEMAFGRYIEYSMDPGIPELRMKEVRNVNLGSGFIKSKKNQVEIVNESFVSLVAGQGIESQTTIKMTDAKGRIRTLYGFGGFENDFVEARVGEDCVSELAQNGHSQSTSDINAAKPTTQSTTEAENEITSSEQVR